MPALTMKQIWSDPDFRRMVDRMNREIMLNRYKDAVAVYKCLGSPDFGKQFKRAK